MRRGQKTSAEQVALKLRQIANRAGADPDRAWHLPLSHHLVELRRADPDIAGRLNSAETAPRDDINPHQSGLLGFIGG